MNYKKELERWGDFGSLDVNKAASRLSLFTSQAASMHTLSVTNDFEMIPERFNVGCGFIPEKTIDALSPRSRLVAIQIIVISPRFGLFKGFFARKYGITKIQVPSSMRKVGPSKSNESFKSDKALLLITKQGRHPTRYNKALGRLRSGTEQQRPPTFGNTTKRLPVMARRILIGLKVPPLMVKEYCHGARRPEKLHHAYFVGVVDPTEEIPSGFLFVTGLNNNNNKHPRIDTVFITR
jgi:hypothetical protein